MKCNYCYFCKKVLNKLRHLKLFCNKECEELSIIYAVKEGDK